MNNTAAPAPLPDALASGAIRWLKVAMVASVALPLALLAATAIVEYDRVVRESTERVHKSASIAREHAMKVLETSEVILGRALDLVGTDSDARIAMRARALHQELRRIQHDVTEVQNIYVWSREGDALVNSRFFPTPPVNIADREDYVSHVERGVRTHVTQPLVGRASGERFFNVSQRRQTPAGDFAGVVTVSLRPQYFSDLYRELGLENGLAMSIWREDGVLIARYPDHPAPLKLGPESMLGRFIRSGGEVGDGRALSHVDGVDRLFAFRKIGPYPLYVTAALEHATIMSQWYRNLAVSALFAVPASLGLLLVTWLALQKTRREQAAVRQWREEAERRASAEEALRQSQKLEAIGQLTGGVAHDFNNLLQVISTNLYILKLKMRGAEAEPQLAAISRALASGETLTKHLLAFSRRRPLQPAPMRLAARFDEIQTLMRHTLRGDITLRCVLDADLWPLHADAEELQMALLNIAVNARDAMPDGGALTVHARNVILPGSEPGLGLRGEFVDISVSDTGHGILPDVLNRVFEPFFTTKAVGKGTGLGLSQVYGFAMQSGGAATIRSAVGRGTTVTLYLPRARQEPAAPAPRAPDADPEPVSGQVMLVEDNAEIGHAVSAVLREMGYTVRNCTSADAALAAIAQHGGIELLVSDIVMPGTMSGLDLARTVGRHHPDISILLMSGYTAEADRAAAEGYRILGKPFRPEALAEAIRRARRTRTRPAAQAAG